MPLNKSYFLSFILFLICNLSVTAQVNFGVGYSLGYLNPSEDIGITNTFNENNSWLDDGLEPLNTIQGFHLSLRYRWDFTAFEIGWRNKFRSKKANGTDPINDSSFNFNYKHKYISYSIGIENFISDFSYGGSIDIENFSIKSSTNDNDSVKLIDKYGLGTHLFVAYNLDAGNSLTFSIRPYVHIPLQDYNIAPVANDLNADFSMNQISENYLNFGIMFVFYNGNK